MPESKELKFVRLKDQWQDLVGYVTYKDECILIETPLKIEVETLFDEGRQILSMQEFLPQSVISIREIEIPTESIMFVTPVKDDFVEQYEYVSDFFYNNKHTPAEGSKRKKKKVDTEKLKENVENVVSILEAMAKKDKGPVH
jgi:hypothetical protein